MLRGFHAMIRKMSRVDTSQKNFQPFLVGKKTLQFLAVGLVVKNVCKT